MLTILLWLLLSVAFFGFGEYWSKVWSLNPSYVNATFVVVGYIFGVLAWLPALYKGQSLTIVGTIWNLLCLCVTLSVGIILFKEQLHATQITGIILAVLAIIFLSL